MEGPLKFTYHALWERIGDPERTILEPDEIESLINSKRAVPLTEGCVFWSDKDQRFIRVVMDKQCDEIITITPADKVPIPYLKLAKLRVIGSKRFFRMDISRLCRKKSDSIEIRVGRGELFNYRSPQILEEDSTALTWLYAGRWAVFNYEVFHRVVADHIERQSRILPYEPNLLILRRGYWVCSLRASLPYEFLGLPSPH
jgi:hypothetical protein